MQDFTLPVLFAHEGGHLKNLYNDYVYFWRWALWKTFENPGTPEHALAVPRPGIVCFITAASYLRGPGFIGMREVMRRTFSELWIIDLEGDNLGARKTENVFAIQTPVCIALGVKLENNDPETAAKVHYARLTGTREEKLAKLDKIKHLADVDWKDAMSDWDDPGVPGGGGAYWQWPKLTDVFPQRFNGVQFKRTWPIGETKALVEKRWETLKAAPPKQKPALFRETAARRVANVYKDINDKRLKPVSDGGTVRITRYAYRSFDRQWIIDDERFADRYRPELWRAYGPQQVYMVSLLTGVLGNGPAAVSSAHVPDLHSFRGSFGGRNVIPLYLDAASTEPNITPGLLDVLATEYGQAISGEDLFAYAYALLATPAYVEEHSEDLTVPGPRLPLTKDLAQFQEGAKLGRALLNLHTYGERFAGSGAASPHVGAARNTKAVPSTSTGYPDDYSYNTATNTLKVGDGEFAPVPMEVFTYSVSGLLVLQSWIKNRLKSGYGRRSSPLDDIRPDVWTADMTRELLELIWLLERTLGLEPEHTKLLKAVEAGVCFTADELPKPKNTDEDDEENEEEEDNGMTSLFAEPE